MEIKIIGKMDHTMDHTFESANRVYGTDGISPTIPTCAGGNIQPKILECVAIRGRNPDNPSDRTPGIETEQRLEVRADGCVGTITTVQKDNMVLESVIVDDIYKCRDERVYKEYAPSIRAEREGLKVVNVRQATKTTENIPNVLEEWTWEIDGEIYLIRIRKLTPRECWRLMGFTDKDFDKAQEVNSNTQLYKQAGNSIVVPVLEGIFRQLMEG